MSSASAAIALRDLTIPEEGSRTAERVLGAALRVAIEELLGIGPARTSDEHRKQELAAFGASLRSPAMQLST